MSDEALVRAVCPSCGAQVEATKEERILERQTPCPACSKTVQFRESLTDEEAILRGASAAAQGAGKVGHFAGGLLKRAAVFGAAKHRDHRRRVGATKELAAMIRAHFQTERPSLERLRRFREGSQAAGAEPQAFTKDMQQDFVRFISREAALLRDGDSRDPVALETIRQYLEAFQLPRENRAAIANAMNVLERVFSIRRGEAKPLTDVAGLVVRNSEVVWYTTKADSIAQKRSGEEEKNDGHLFVTNMRVVFTSRTAPDEIPLSDINAVEIENGRIFLLGKSQRRSSEFAVRSPEIAAEHIRQAVRVYHRQVDVGFERGNSRHITQDVKTVVWQRDGGKCVQCGATDYLEFDHIIPVAKGGANGVENIQLLCRRCNAKKRDRI